MIAITYLKCECCNGNGVYTEELTGNAEPWCQDYHDVKCEECNGKGSTIDLEDMLIRVEYKYGVYIEDKHGLIEATNKYIQGLTNRKEVILYSINALRLMGLGDELYKRYANRLDSVNKGIERVKHYKQIIETYEANI